MEVEESNLEEFIIVEKRHRELISVIKGIMAEIPKNEIDLSVLEKIRSSIESLLQKQNKEIKFPDNSKAQLEVITVIKKLGDDFKESIDELKQLISEKSEPVDYEFTIERSNGSNLITKVIAKSKQ
jgi:ElaB/YqjD/DUF883 family membrane-anchored ribosome-binding protein